MSEFELQTRSKSKKHKEMSAKQNENRELDEQGKKALESLPLASKLQILSQLDLGIQKKVLSPDSDMLVGVEFIRNLDSNPNLAKKLRKFSRNDLLLLENDDVIIRDGVLGNEIGKLARQEVSIPIHSMMS